MRGQTVKNLQWKGCWQRRNCKGTRVLHVGVGREFFCRVVDSYFYFFFNASCILHHLASGFYCSSFLCDRYNQAVGDATCDALFVESVLAIKGWSVNDWDLIYQDLPSRQTKVKVQDRTVVVPLADETAVVEPVALKDAIAAAVQSVDAENGRAFARPSGTEDVVRVYAEASTPELADELAAQVAKAIYDHANGVGDAPVKGVWA